MCSFTLQVLRIFYVVIALGTGIFGAGPAHAVLLTFSGPWDPTAANSGFSLRATAPGSSATMQLSPDRTIFIAHLTLANCYHGCGAFYLDNVSGNLPHGRVQFEWTLSTSDMTVDGQIAIDGADSTINDGARDILLYPSQFSGSADIDYQGGPFTFFNIGIGAETTGNTTAILEFGYFSAPDAPRVNFSSPSNAATKVAEPAGLAIFLLGVVVLFRLRKQRLDVACTGQLVAGPQRFQTTGWAAPSWTWTCSSPINIIRI